MHVPKIALHFRLISIFKSFLALFFLAVSSISYAATITITGNHIITTPTVYQNSTLEMSDGRFTINAGGSLTLDNCVVNIKISPTNPFLVLANQGNINFNKTVFNVTSEGITPNPSTRSAYNLIDINIGNLSLTDNAFTINNEYTVGVLTTQNSPNNGFVITNNSFKHFHGGIYLSQVMNPMINNNKFERVSFANIYFSGSLAQISNNFLAFPGNVAVGDGIDLVNANSVTISNNIISSSAGYGILMMGAQNISINNNKITDGFSYGIYIRNPALLTSKDQYLKQLYKKTKAQLTNNTITLTNNYIEQNRYGLAGETVDNLIVTNNIFIQRFDDSSVRQFWTNNDNLLPFASNLIWSSNYYKEAFTQEVPGDNTNALQFLVFPEHGGVYLP